MTLLHVYKTPQCASQSVLTRYLYIIRCVRYTVCLSGTMLTCLQTSSDFSNKQGYSVKKINWFLLLCVWCLGALSSERFVGPVFGWCVLWVTCWSSVWVVCSVSDLLVQCLSAVFCGWHVGPVFGWFVLWVTFGPVFGWFVLWVILLRLMFGWCVESIGTWSDRWLVTPFFWCFLPCIWLLSLVHGWFIWFYVLFSPVFGWFVV